MYEHKILCFFEYEEEDDEETDDQKTLQPCLSEDDGEIFADISDGK